MRGLLYPEVVELNRNPLGHRILRDIEPLFALRQGRVGIAFPPNPALSLHLTLKSYQQMQENLSVKLCES